MNGSFIRYTLGTVLKIMALIFVVPVLTAACYRETQGFSYLAVGIMCLVIGLLLTLKKPDNNVFFLRDGCVMTVISWIALSFFGGLPFYFTGEMNGSFVDSMFESVSGFTTTGATILTNVEVLSKCTQMWRSLSHWIGGMGVLVFLLALIPLSSGSNINLMRAESTGPSVGKLVPKIKETARILYTTYTLLTLLQMLLLAFGKVPLFDAINIAFSTTGTGGFGIWNDSLASYSAYAQWVTIIFMIASALRFEVYYYIVARKFSKVFSEEVVAYLLILIISTAVIYLDLKNSIFARTSSLRDAAFATASIMSTTGFATKDFNIWPVISRTVLVLLTFIGGCTGSTGGGFKVSRLVILFKSFRREIRSYISPRLVKKVTMDKAPLDEEVIRSTSAYFSIYMIIFVISIMIVSLAENSLITNFTSVAACFNNVGPGLARVGPIGNYFFHTDLSKIVLIFDMLAGRLEIFPILIFFSKDTVKAAIGR